MSNLIKITVIALILSIIFGPLAGFPAGILGVNIYLTDILAVFVLFFRILKFEKSLNLILNDVLALIFTGFISIAFISLLLSPLHLVLVQKLISSLYLFRLIAYFSVYLSMRDLLRTKNLNIETVKNLLIVVSISISLLGWIQYFLYPDLRNLYYLGWDPHFKRIFSTYLDPNYFGMMMVLSFVLLLTQKDFWGRKLLMMFFFTTLMFTYSRSSFMAFIAAIVYFSMAKRRFKLLLGILFLVFFSIVLLPRPAGAGVILERTFSIETRMDNWLHAFKVFSNHPAMGSGFNTIRYAKEVYNINQDNLSQNHAGAGFDNSFLFVAATAGIFGLITYLSYIIYAFKKGKLLMRTSLVAVATHALFLNSLFFPWIMLWIWIIIGIRNFTE